jgi:hypothetical protein
MQTETMRPDMNPIPRVSLIMHNRDGKEARLTPFSRSGMGGSPPFTLRMNHARARR